VIFTGSASESNTTALRGTLAANPDRRHVITTAVEHPSVMEVCKDFQRNGYEVTFLPVSRSGQLEFKDLIHALRPDTALVTIMHVNNETGVVFPVEKLAKIVKLTDPRVIFHTDATQSVGKLPIDLSGVFLHVDLLSFSGHKLHAPKGIGVLYMRKGTRCRPLLIGGHQENGRRAGTENVPYIVGLGKACELAAADFRNTYSEKKTLRNRLEAFILENIPYCYLNGRETGRLPTTTSVSFECVEGESVLYALGEHGICASTGSACSSGSLAPSHVLQAMHIPLTAAHGTLRFSYGRFTTEADIDALIAVLPGIIARLRTMSPYWDTTANRPNDSTIALG